MDSFTAVSGADLDLKKFHLLVGGPIMALGAAGGSGLMGAMLSLATFDQVAPQLYEEMRRDLRDIAAGGVTLLAAPGFTGTFNAVRSAPGFGQQQFLYPGDVVFGWNPPAADGGLVVNQFRFPGVFAKRPFGMTQQRNGRRAIVPYFQTGNFGVLDLDFQPLPSPAVAGLPATMFAGTVAVTRAIELDNHLWPSRGVFQSGDVTVQSPDEALLYTWQAEYAQNGRFAVASHAGAGKPYSVTVPLPDWQASNSALAALSRLGFTTFSGSSAQDPNGVPVSVGQPYEFHRGGGAISILDDGRIGADLGAHIPPAGPEARPYFSSNPISSDAVRHITGYQSATGSARFYEPRGVAVAPFITLESPSHGDLVNLGTAVQIHWRDSHVSHYQVVAEDMAGSQKAKVVNSLTAAQRASRSFSITLGELLRASTPAPASGDRLRIIVSVLTSSSFADELSTASIVITLDR